MLSNEGMSKYTSESESDINKYLCRFEKRIYIPLPGPEARRRMFEIHVGNTPCQLTPKDYRTLADRTDGFSGSDISTVVRDALMQPVRKVISATHFKQVANPETENGEPKKWTPCSPGDPKAVEKAWSQIGSNELLEPPLRIADFLKSLDNTRPTVTQADIARHDKWTMESGTRGVFFLCLFQCKPTQYFSNCRKRWSVTAYHDLVIKSTFNLKPLSISHAFGNIWKSGST